MHVILSTAWGQNRIMFAAIWKATKVNKNDDSPNVKRRIRYMKRFLKQFFFRVYCQNDHSWSTQLGARASQSWLIFGDTVYTMLDKIWKINLTDRLANGTCIFIFSFSRMSNQMRRNRMNRGSFMKRLIWVTHSKCSVVLKAPWRHLFVATYI